MLSLKQRIFNFFYKRVIKPIDIFDGTNEFKRNLVKYGGYILAKRTKSMNFEIDRLGQTEFLKCSDGQITSSKIIFFIHGGGFSSGGAKTHQHIAARLAGLVGGISMLPTYPLAPENPFPIGLNFIHDFYQSLLTQGHLPKDIIIAGDSAGGNLCVALLLLLLNNDEPIPSGAILFSPALDLTHSNPTHIFNAKTELMISPKLSKQIAKNYLQGQDPKNPLASPLFGELNNPPPFLIFASGCEVFYGDAVDFATNLKTGGHDVTLHTEPKLPHVWQFLWGQTREADKSIGQCKEFMKRL